MTDDMRAELRRIVAELQEIGRRLDRVADAVLAARLPEGITGRSSQPGPRSGDLRRGRDGDGASHLWRGAAQTGAHLRTHEMEFQIEILRKTETAEDGIRAA